MKNKLIILTLFISYLFLFTNCKKETDNSTDLSNEAVILLNERAGIIRANIDGQSREFESLLFNHPSNQLDTSNIAGDFINDFLGELYLIGGEELILALLNTGETTASQSLIDGKNYDFFSISLSEYNGVGRYNLNSSDELCYYFGEYDKDKEELVDGDDLCSDATEPTSNQGFVEITTDANGILKGNFSITATSWQTGNNKSITGSFESSY